MPPADAAPRERDAAECARRRLDVDQSVREAIGAAHHRGGRIVELVREAGGQLAERPELLVLQVGRRELPGAVQHDVHELRRELRTLLDERGNVLARDLQNLGWLFGLHVARRRHQPRVRQQSRDVAGVPVHDLDWSRAAIDLDREVAGQDDEQSADRSRFRREDVPDREVHHLAMTHEPLEFRGGRARQGTMLGQTFDEIRGHPPGSISGYLILPSSASTSAAVDRPP